MGIYGDLYHSRSAHKSQPGFIKKINTIKLNPHKSPLPILKSNWPCLHDTRQLVFTLHLQILHKIPAESCRFLHILQWKEIASRNPWSSMWPLASFLIAHIGLIPLSWLWHLFLPLHHCDLIKCLSTQCQLTYLDTDWWNMLLLQSNMS